MHLIVVGILVWLGTELVFEEIGVDGDGEESDCRGSEV